ncbi:hypothetical protein [Streptomyces doebereineriae]|uniref:Uncharacterized protein n=1 Tax=Streptomyces doebereineriae TaxID=3075528 RepID=A0ABU2VFS0_9ACTN|nr:hypothetical protein [Streptomyces sp. DSM 41640]MDT0483807.1 hypothetical protein [Streptomyces sp. DSM 41640]
MGKVNPISTGEHLIVRSQSSAAANFLLRWPKLNLPTHDHRAVKSSTASLILGLIRTMAAGIAIHTPLLHVAPSE